MPDSPGFLGVARSVTGRRWQDRLDDAAARGALAMAQQHGIGSTLSRVLAGRGVSIAEAPSFLAPRLKDLMPDPSGFADMDKAAARLAMAVTRRESVAIFGDYDVDGACSAALLGGWLGRLGVPYRIHIPDRITEGYGPNNGAIDMLADAGARLLVTVDCGTMSHGSFRHARSRGLDIVVLDHHQAGDMLPEVDALVNPNRQDDLSGQGHLCAAGVVFLTLVAANRALRQAGAFAGTDEPDLMAELDIAALATIADVVPLKGLNRAFVAQGLKIMARRERPGLRALMDVARLNEAPVPYHLGFLLGPRINAGGRIGDAGLGCRLLLTRDDGEAKKIAADLDRLNQERRVVEQDMLAQAEEEAQRQIGITGDGAPVLLTASPDWHPGVVGLVAARLKERYRRPAFAIAWGEDGQGSGSARSISGVDIGALVRGAVERGLLVKGGGHAMAAGITILRAQFEAFAAHAVEVSREAVERARADDAVMIDAAVTASGATVAMLQEIEQAGPFGQGNPQPVFALPSHRLADVFTVGEHHLRCTLRSGDGAAIRAMAFRAAGTPLGDALIKSRGETVHAAGTLAINRYGGRESAEFRLLDLALPVRA